MKQFIRTMILTLIATLAITTSSGIVQAKQKGDSAASAPAPTVTSIKVETSLLPRNISAIGSLKPSQSVDIAAQINGRVSQLHIEEGLPVKQGETLVTLDSREQTAKVTEAKVTLADATRQFNYIEALYKRKAISKDELEAQKSQVDKLRASLEVAQTTLSYYTLTAPFSGALSFSDTSVGALVNSGQVITSLDDLSTMKLYFELPANTLSSVPHGSEIIATTDVWPGIEYAGKIDSISPRINPDNLTFTARAVLDNSKNELRPGMMVRISVQQQSEKTLTVPARSVMFDGNEKFVYLIDQQNKAHKQFIQTGAILEEKIAVIEGLSSGDTIVDEGVVKVRDGKPVKIIEAEIADTSNQSNDQKSKKGNMAGKGEAQS